MLVARELLEPDDVVAVTFGGYSDTYQRVADLLEHAPQLLLSRMWVYPPRLAG